MVALKVACVSGWLLLAASGAGGGQAQEEFRLKRFSPGTDLPRRDEKLDQTIEKVKRSFVERDASELDGCFGESKVYISFESVSSKPGFYTPGQIHFLFEKLFRGVATRSFKHSSADITVSRGNRAFLHSDWTYVVLGKDDVVTERLHFTFEKEGGDWRISDIRSSSR